MPPKMHRPHQQIGAFRVTSCQRAQDLGCLVTTLQHGETGARILHIGNDDPENLFCLAFLTPALDSSGISHVLEHCALCGSKNYLVKDPFFSMVRRSLNTFMNAFTGSDFTCYPAASQVRADFYNLFDVYLDAAFSPRLDELSFLQEGIRREIVDRDQLQFKGIVYNEMKGAYASSEKRLYSHLLAQLLPKTSHRFDSGGDPKCIPSLTLKALRLYHQRYYHPNRALIYLYGDIPLKDHLHFLQKRLFHQVPAALPLPKEAIQKRRLKPNYLTRTYPSGDDQTTHQPLFGISWWTGDLQSTEDLWLITLLDELLMGSDGAPLKRQLIEQDLCKQVQSSLETESPQIAYSLILKGCSTDQVRVLTQGVLDLLIDIAKKGFAKEQIEAATHRMELQHLEIESGHYPYGLALFWRAGLSYQHGADPHAALSIAEQLRTLKRLGSQPDLLKSHFKRLLIDNQHRSSVALRPDPDLAQKEQSDETGRLELLKQKLTPSGKRRIEQQSLALQTWQNRQEDLGCLPQLPISSIPKAPHHFELLSAPFQSGMCHYHKAHTNGFVFIDCFIPIPCQALHASTAENITPSAALWRLLANFLPLMGTSELTFSQNSEKIAAHSGGVGADISCFSSAVDEQFHSYLHLRIKGLGHKLPMLFSLLADVAFRARFDDAPRLRELLAQQSLALEQNLARDATSYVVHAASCAHSKLARDLSRLWGFGYLEAMRALFGQVSQDPEKLQSALLQPLCALKRSLPPPEHLVITCGAREWMMMQKERFYGFDQHFTAAKPIAAKKSFQLNTELFAREVGFSIPAQVASNALALPGCGYSDPNFANLQLLAQLLQHKVLHPEIREKGGAYGSGALCRSDWRSFTLFSARDPNIAATKEIFCRAVQNGCRDVCSDQELQEAKRVVIQQLDSPVQPGDRGAAAFGWQMRKQSLALRSEHRQRLLNATPEQVRLCCELNLLGPLSCAGFASASEKLHLHKEMPALSLHRF